MRMTKLFVSVVFALSMTACGDDGGGGGGQVDAPVQVDAAPDAPAASALGQKCGQGMPACPASAPDCLTVGQGATTGFCSLLCHADAQFMTNAQSQPASGTDLTADNSKCTAIFNSPASQGEAGCFLPVNRTPAGALAPNTTYTYQAYCAIDCTTSNACPTGLTCNAQKICAP